MSRTARGWLATCLTAGAIVGATGCAPEVDRPSLLLITLDTTRADRLGAYGCAEAGTPRLDALANAGALFEWAFTPVPITLPSHASILTGLYPNRHGIHDNAFDRLDPRFTTLAEILQAADYRTAAILSAFPLDARFGLDQGFDVYDDEIAMPGGARLHRQRLAEEVVADASSWLATLDDDDRFFLWAHFFDPHASYKPPGLYANWYQGDLYQGEIAYMDEWIGKLLQHLSESGRADDTLVVVVADHGESLGEHDEISHAHLIYNATMRVPLIMRGPGIRPGVRIPTPVSTVDLLPTLLDLLSLETQAELQGRSLAGALRGEPAPPRPLYLESYHTRLRSGASELQGVVSGDWKFIEAPAAGGVAELYEVSADPDELHDRSADEPDVSRRLREELDSLREQASENPAIVPPRELAEDERRELEALGYLSAHADLGPEGPRHPRDVMKVESAYVKAVGDILLGHSRRAKPFVEEIERRAPGSVLAHETRGRYLLSFPYNDTQRTERALAELESALALAPHRAELWGFVAQAHLRLGDAKAGLQHFQQATKLGALDSNLQHSHRLALENLNQQADELERLGDYPQAALILEALAEADAADPALAQRAEALRRRSAEH